MDASDKTPRKRARRPRARKTPIRAALVLRPEPGCGETAMRLAARGIPTRRCPLYFVRPRPWSPPDAGAYDALLITSANAIRHGGPGLDALIGLPVCAVGEATASAARRAGFEVVLTGQSDVATLASMARPRGLTRLLHLAGEERQAVPRVDWVTVYGSDKWTLTAQATAQWPGHVALLHSPRAARDFAKLTEEHGLDRRSIAIAAISDAAAKAAGDGWAACAVADAPRDDLLVAVAAGLIDREGAAADKPPG